jgi:hypothetical protein
LADFHGPAPERSQFVRLCYKNWPFVSSGQAAGAPIIPAVQGRDEERAFRSELGTGVESRKEERGFAGGAKGSSTDSRKRYSQCRDFFLQLRRGALATGWTSAPSGGVRRIRGVFLNPMFFHDFLKAIFLSEIDQRDVRRRPMVKLLMAHWFTQANRAVSRSNGQRLAPAIFPSCTSAANGNGSGDGRARSPQRNAAPGRRPASKFLQSCDNTSELGEIGKILMMRIIFIVG